MLSVTITEGEKKDLESKILELEAQRSAVNKQTKELKNQAEELEVHNQSLQTQLKTSSERKLDITPFRDHAYLIRRNMHQVQLKLADKIYKIK